MSFSLKNYSEIAKFADGGLSELFCGVERSTNRSVVIKKIALDPTHRSSSLKRLENEARNSLSLSHSNIISIIDYGNDGDNFYIVMEHIEGCDFNTFISDSSFNRKVGLMIVFKALEALRFSHKNGIVHCNIKPANLLISNTGRVVLSDFSLSLSNAHAKASQNGCADFATPLFMPPEQAYLVTEQDGLASEVWAECSSVNNNDISAKQSRVLKERGMQRDIWSAGILLYLVCSGYYPFYSNDLTHLFVSIKYLDPTKISQLVTDLPQPISAVIEQCLKKKPHERPHSLDPVIMVFHQYFVSLGISHIDETIAAYVQEKMGVPSFSSESDLLSDDIAGDDLLLALQTESKWNHTENKTIQHVPPRQLRTQHDTGFLHTQIKKSKSFFSRNLKNALNIVRSSTSLFFNPRIRIALPMIVLTTLLFLVVLGIFVISAYTRKPLQFTSFTPSNIVKMYVSLINHNVQSAYLTNMLVQNHTDTTGKAIASVSRDVRMKIDSSSGHVSSAEYFQTRTATPALSINKTAITKPEILSGVLKITVNPPEAQVFIDGSLIVQDEMAKGKRVAPGSHKIVANATEYITYNKSIRIESNKTKVLSLNLKSDVKGNGQLHIYSYPWANLYVDDVLTGTTPTPSPISLVEGNHRVVLKQDGFQPYSELVIVITGVVTRLQIQLKKTGEE